MYKKYLSLLLLGNMILVVAFFNAKGILFNKLVSRPAYETCEQSQEVSSDYMGMVSQASSGQRVVDYDIIEKKFQFEVSQADYDALLRIVEAEAGCEDETGKLLVANVVLNRVKSDKFPDSIEEVILQKENGTTQFSPVANGSFYTIEVTEETREVVDRALCGEDVSQGALYFAARKYANPDKMKWFDTHLTFLFEYGGHEFFS